MSTALKKRPCGRLGASQLASVLGLGGFGGSPWNVWAREHGHAVEEDRPELIRGRYLERAVADWYADQAPVKILPPEIWAGHPVPLPGPDPIEGSPDRIVMDLEGFAPTRLWGLEAKTSRSKDGWGQAGTDQVPVYYAVQCHAYMAVTGLERWDLAVLFTLSEEFTSYRLERNAALWDEILRRAREWWDRHILHGEEPPVDGSDGCGEAIASMFPCPKTPLRLASVEEAELMGQVLDARAQAKREGKLLAAAENRLKFAISDAEGLRYAGLSATWKLQTRTSIDSKALRADHPELARLYERTSEFRVLHVSNKE